MSFGDELDTTPILTHILATGRTLVLPRMTTDNGAPALALHRVDSLNDLLPGKWGIREPRADAPLVTLSDIDFALVPGVAFDLEGNRLGYGKGYYDRLLAKRPASLTVAAVAFDCQVVDAVPVEPHDAKIDILITPSGVHHFQPKSP
jgi:5-formyltetrahydrofolate cyclo-ligase